MATFRSFWFGEVSPYEWLSMKSFVDYGHRYILYSYDSIEVPQGIELADAGTILPRKDIFFYGDKAGIGRGSIAGFSNRFRYELLHVFGEWWVDADVVCLSEKVTAADIFLGWDDEKFDAVGNAILRFPKGHPFVAKLKAAATQAGSDIAWGDTGASLISSLIDAYGLSNSISISSLSYPISSADALHLLIPSRYVDVRDKVQYVSLLHTWNEVRRRAVVLPWISPPHGSFAAELFRRHGVTFPGGYTYTADQLERLNENYTSFTHWNWHRPRIDLQQSMLEAAHEDIEILRCRYLGAMTENGSQRRGRSHYANAVDHPEVNSEAAVRKAVSILDYGPKQVTIGESFNPQPNGRSAIWLIASAKPPDRCRISFDGELLNTTICGRLVTAAIPQPLLEVPGVVKINLVDGAGRSIADDVELSIKPDVPGEA